MSSLWVPREAQDRMNNEANAIGEAVRVVEFTERLRAFDPRLECFLATQDTEDGGIRKGFYHIARRNEDGSTAVWMVHDMGAFREPDERDIEALRMLDLRNPARVREMRERRERALREREAEKARREDERLGELEERLAHLTTTSVRVPRAA